MKNSNSQLILWISLVKKRRKLGKMIEENKKRLKKIQKVKK